MKNMENEQEKEGKKVGRRRKNKRASPPTPLRRERGVISEILSRIHNP